MDTIRKLLEQAVRAYHRHIPPPIISNMDVIELLRWAHPIDRADAASKLWRGNVITKEQAEEFVKIL